jgi:hypothetical protein
MTAVAAIRTHRWGEDEERLLAALRPVFGNDLAVVFHKRPGDLHPPVRTIDLTPAWVVANGLRIVWDWGWRCGDYACYALRAALPGYRHYWLIEPDLHFTAPPAPFFDAFARVETDVLGYRIGPFPASNRFAVDLRGVAPHRAIFALTRLSGRALDRLLPVRQSYARSQVRPVHYANDEVFVFSHAMADPDLSVGNLEEVAPSWFDGAVIETNPDMLLDLVEADAAGRGRVCHPVRGRSGFVVAVAERLTANQGFLGTLQPSLARLDDAEIDAIAARVAGDTRHALRRHREMGPGGRHIRGRRGAAARPGHRPGTDMDDRRRRLNA